jgi:hypothetical protein
MIHRIERGTGIRRAGPPGTSRKQFWRRRIRELKGEWSVKALERFGA